MRGLGIRAVSSHRSGILFVRTALALLASLTASVRAETVDFEAPAYLADKTFLGADQWAASALAPQTSDLPAVAAVLPENFLVQAGSAGKWAHIRTSAAAAVLRPFPALGAIMDLRWKWRALGDSVRLCLGVSGSAPGTPLGNRARACMEPSGALSATGAALGGAGGAVPGSTSGGSIPSAETWKTGTWYYMRLVLDNAANQFTLYLSEDSLRGNERVAVPAAALGGSGSFSRLVVETGGGSAPGSAPGYGVGIGWDADLDDIAWEAVSLWMGGMGGQGANPQDSNWTTAANWSGHAVPEGMTQVVFSTGSGCDLDKNASVSTITVNSEYKGTLKLGKQTLTVAGKADFTGGTYTYAETGRILFASARGHSLTGPLAGKVLAPVRHEGAGALRLDGRDLYVAQFDQIRGAFDFNGFDLIVNGDLSVKNGGPGTLRNLDGRAISVGRAARLEGVSKDTLLGLATAPKGWILSGSGPDSLQARFAALGNARASAHPGYAFQSLDVGGNSGWSFPTPQVPDEAPFALPRTRSFPDTLRVTLAAKGGDAVIHYTLDGSDPNPASPRYSGNGLLIDSTTVLKAIAVKNGEISPTLSETYTLIPDTPSASPRGGDYSSFVDIQLSVKSVRARLFYTLDGSPPGPERGLPPYKAGTPIRLDTSATLKIIAVTGQGPSLQRSPVRTETYTFIRPGARQLGPGTRIALSGNYSLASPLSGAAPVQVEVLATDSLKSLKGFRDVLFGIRLSVPEGATAFPKVAFNAPGGEPRSMYSLNANGSARWITGADTCELPGSGTYFLGVDTLAPVITYSGEPFTEDDSTRLVVSIQDNVANLLLDLERSDNGKAVVRGQEISSPMFLSVPMKNPPGSLAPLTVRLLVDDHSRKSAFPADGSLYPLAQRITQTVHTPTAFHIGTSRSDPWDLIAIPLASEPPLTLAQLRKNNSVPELDGVGLDSTTGKYRYLGDTEPLLPGAAVWIAAYASLPSLSFPALQTSGHQGSGGYRIRMRPGWNLVANPTMAPLFWPVTRAFPEAYDASLLKGLVAWDAQARKYAPSENLEPWRGYFAYYKGATDTAVDLLSQPVTSPAAKAHAAKTSAASRSSASGPAKAAGVSIRLLLDDGPALRLGASGLARDGLGVEDDPQPVSPADNGPKLFAVRGGMRLTADLVAWKEGGLCLWTLVAGMPALPRGENESDAAAPGASARVEGLSLPAGYAAWAWSRKRGLRFPMIEGSGIPLSPGFTDSLDILAGPTAELEARLASIPTSVGAFTALASTQAGRIALDLRLPRAARLSMTLWSMDGRARDKATLDLPAGFYHLDRGGRSGFSAGLYVLALDWTVAGTADPAGSGTTPGDLGANPTGGSIPRRITLKIAIP
ncbi:MAG: chitobiase/beta-hexosaminidase C-terminal domain-containing protein [Fibrobacteria bacterium]